MSPSIPRAIAEKLQQAIHDGLQPLREREQLSLSQWANRHFYLSPESSGTQGAWETRAYQRAIMDVISLDDVEVVSWQKCGRVGYTKIIVAAIGYFASHKRRNQAVWQPTDGDAQDFVKDEIEPMLRDVSTVGRLLKTDPEKKSKHNTVEKKSFIGSVLDIKGGKSSKNYRRMTKDVGYYDELDGFDTDIDRQGDATSLGDKRLTQSAFPKSIRGSTPTIKDISQIEKSISYADMRFHRFIPCPECGVQQELAWSKILYQDRDGSTARHLCEDCGHGMTYADYQDMDAQGRWCAMEHDKQAGAMLPSGEWIDESTDEIILRDADGEEIPWPRHVGFWIWGAYSYDLSWPQLVEEFIEANDKKKVGAIESLKTFVNMRLGETWEEEGETVDHHMLYRRREHYRAEVPDGVQVLTAFVDVQDDRLEYEVAGWGHGEECWSIAYERLYGDLSNVQIWDTLAKRLRRQFQREDGTLIDIKLVGIDTGGHFTDQTYQFSLKNGVRWIIPTKGSSERAQPIAKFPTKRNAKGVYLTMIGADTAKEVVYKRYEVQAVGEGYCHYPVDDAYDEAFFEQATAEKKMKHYKLGVPYYTWDAQKRRNEVLDCRVGNLAMVRVLQAHFGIHLIDEVRGEVVPIIPRIQSRPVNSGAFSRRNL